MAGSALRDLAAAGQSVWLDYLSRDLLRSGRLAQMVADDAVSGVTSNPTIFQKAISGGSEYDEQLRDTVAGTPDPAELFVALAAHDVGEACDLLRPVWDTTSGRDGYVSMEVDPGLAYDTEATAAQARRLHGLIDRPNLLVKIPGTRPGLPAVEDMIARGKSVNVTLIFSLERYADVAAAYVRGLERLAAAGGPLAAVHSVASFFVSRVDTEADRRLDDLGAPGDLKGKLAVANAKLAYQRYLEVFSGERWEELAAKGARPQRCLWASTSTKNPAYSDVMYVEELIGPDTVNTMPEETIAAFRDHGRVAPTLTAGVDDARRHFERIAEAGVDVRDVTDTLEREGVQKFADSYSELIDGIRAAAAGIAA